MKLLTHWDPARTPQEMQDRVEALTQWPTSEYFTALRKRQESKSPWKVETRAVLTKGLRLLVLQLLNTMDRRREALAARVSLGSLIELPKGSPFMRTFVDVVVLDETTRRPLVLVFRHPPSPTLVNELGWQRVPYLSVDLQTNTAVEEAARVLERARATDPSPKVKALPFQQRLLRQHIRDALWVRTDSTGGDLPPEKVPAELRKVVLEEIESHGWLVLEEVALGALIRCASRLGRAVEGFVQTSSIDILVATSGAGPSVPMLAVEFDGEITHKRFGSQIRDALKDTLLADANIPLIRVREREANMTRWLGTPSDHYARMMSHIEPLKRIIRLIVNRLASEWRSAHMHLEEVLAIDTLAQTLYAKHYVDLTEEQRFELSFSSEYSEIVLQTQLDQHIKGKDADADNAMRENFGLFLASQRLDPCRAESFSFDRLCPGKWTGQFTFINSDGSRRVVALSEIAVHSTGLPEERLADAVAWYLREEAADIIRDLTGA